MGGGLASCLLRADRNCTLRELKIYLFKMPTVLVFLNESQIFQAERRTHQAGLGSSKPIRGNNPNENYKDAVKRTLYERYQDYD